jgi:hypothetical protein
MDWHQAERDAIRADFEALGELEDHARLFWPPELDELRALLGLYGVETDRRLPPGGATADYVSGRPQHWADVRLRARDPARARVAERAAARYGHVLHGLLRGEPPG